MTSPELESLVRIGKLKKETGAQAENGAQHPPPILILRQDIEMLSSEISQQAILLKKNKVGILCGEIVAVPVFSSAPPALKLKGEKCADAGAED
jgi:hypothetical protein